MASKAPGATCRVNELLEYLLVDGSFSTTDQNEPEIYEPAILYLRV